MNQNIKNFYKKCNAYKRVCLGGTSMKLCVSAPGKRFGDASGGCAGNPKNNSIRHPLFACTAGFMRPSGVSLFNAIGEIVKGGLRIVLERKPGLFNQVPGRGETQGVPSQASLQVIQGSFEVNSRYIRIPVFLIFIKNF